MSDCYYLASGKVLFIAEPVAAVAATSEDVADEALTLIDIEYEPLEPIFDVVKAMQEGAPLVHENLAQYRHAPRVYPVGGSNICHHSKLRKGEVDKSLVQADSMLEQQYWCQKVQHCSILRSWTYP